MACGMRHAACGMWHAQARLLQREPKAAADDGGPQARLEQRFLQGGGRRAEQQVVEHAQGEGGLGIDGLAVEQPREGHELRRRAGGRSVRRVGSRDRVRRVEQRLPRDALDLGGDLVLAQILVE